MLVRCILLLAVFGVPAIAAEAGAMAAVTALPALLPLVLPVLIKLGPCLKARFLAFRLQF